jgi:5'-methylthioinosine phosphorylase
MANKIAIIGGSGLSNLGSVDDTLAIANKVGERQTPYGETSADILQNQTGKVECFFLARHGNPHHIAPHRINYRANLWALNNLGVERIIAVNAVGGINPSMPPASLVLPDQLIDYSHSREGSFFDGVHEPLNHIDFSYPFSAAVCDQLAGLGLAEGIPIHQGGVYGVTQGPRLETAAEISRLAKDGCDLVGMTAMPEAALARELGLEYASICLVVNPAACCSDKLITMDEIHAVLDKGMSDVRRLLGAYVRAL